MSDSYMAQPGAIQQPTTATDWSRPAPDDPDTIVISISWRSSRPNLFWIDINGKPLRSYHPLQGYPHLELGRAACILHAAAGQARSAP